MKKLTGIVLILLSTFFTGNSQEQNNTTDDVYYNDADQPTAAPIDQNNYDVNNDDNSAAPTYQTFYDQLSPYGNWVNYPGYGYCWVPNQLDPGFSPYTTNGHWVYTDLGWTWVSDFAWGWGPFHYGRWFEDPSYGWIWEPGYDWAPAWVIWGDYDGYYGWACLGPGEVLSPHYRPQRDHWHFVEHQYMGRPDFGQHMHHADEVAHGRDINSHINIIAHANTYHQSVFFEGPKPAEVERFSGQHIEVARINNVRDPHQTQVSGNQINIYRPSIVRSNTQHAAPSKVSNQQDMKPVNRPQPDQQQRNNTNQQPVRQQNQNWTPPRQNVQPQREYSEPQRRANAPIQPQRQQYNAPAQPQRTFVPSERPVQQQHYSAPAQQQHYSAPAQPHYSAPPSMPRGGGGRR